MPQQACLAQPAQHGACCPVQGRGTGWAVWDGAPAAAKFLEAAAAALKLRQPALSSVLELGSGTGLAGLAAAAALQLPTLLTDLPEVLPALRHNIEANPALAALVSAAPLDWRQPQASPALCWLASSGQAAGSSGSGCGDAGTSPAMPGSGGGGCSGSQGARPPRLVLAADCAWLSDLVQPFVQTLQLAASQPGDLVLLAYQSRSSAVDALLFGQLAEAGFAVEAALPLPGEPDRGPVDMYWLKSQLSCPLASNCGKDLCVRSGVMEK